MTTSAVVLIIISVILTACVAFLGWLAQTVYNLHAEVSVIKAQQATNSSMIKDLIDHGSPVIRELVAEIRALKDGQMRIEKILEERIESRMINLEEKISQAAAIAATAAATADASAAKLKAL